MKLKKVTRVDKTVYEIIYTNFWGVSKRKLIFPFLYSWRYCETGKRLPYEIDVSIGNLARDLEISQSTHTTPELLNPSNK